MTISLQTQTQYTSAFQASSSASVNSMQKEAPASNETANSFEITDVYERSADSAASTAKFSTYSNIVGSSNTSSSVSLLDSSSEDSEEDETTELIYNADGSVYEKTTTTDEDGNETVTMTKISDAKSDTEESALAE